MLRVCVFGAGAVGSLLASRLMHAGNVQVSIVARGAHLQAIRQHGLKLLSPEGQWIGRPAAATDRPRELPPQDIVFVTLKVMAQSSCAGDIAALLAPGGHATFANNGIPWWWMHGLADAAPLPLVDSGGALWRELGPARALGCVIYSASELVAPGVVQFRGNNRWVIGEPACVNSERLQLTVELLQAAGFGAVASGDIRREVWIKLLRNVALNSICALTRLSVDALTSEPGLISLADAVIGEVAAIAHAQGHELSQEVAATRASLRSGAGINGKQLTGVKPSMLQDVLAARPMEVEAILGQVQQLAQQSGSACPVLDCLVPLMRGLNAASHDATTAIR